MKKLIAILVVFAVVAGAAFAQDAGTWSISGSGQIGTRIDFKPLFVDWPTPSLNDPASDHAEVYANKYDLGGDNADDVRGNLSIGYSKGIISTSIGFNQKGAISASVQANGEGFQFRASRDLYKLINGSPNYTNDGDLWGNYTFNVLNGIFIEAAVKKDGGQWEQGFDTWTHHDRLSNNYLLVDVKPMAGLSLGFKLPDIFSINGNSGVKKDFMDDSLRRIVFGVKYDVSPIAVAFQFGLSDYGLNYSVTGGKGGFAKGNRIYLGARYTISPQMSTGVYFRGDFGFKNYTIVNPDSSDFGKAVDNSQIIIGGDFSYGDGPLGAGLRLRFWDDNTAKTTDLPKDKLQWFRIGANVRYDLVASYLRFKLDVEINIPITGENSEKTNKMTYQFTPELIYNFLGTGAGDFGGTSMAIGYRVAGAAEASLPAHTRNDLTIAFRWGF